MGLRFILLPVALLVLAASIRYAFRPVGVPAVQDVTAETGSIIRDWSPFLVFLMLYESFGLHTWQAVSAVDKDALLLRWDTALFGTTPAVIFDSWIPWLAHAGDGSGVFSSSRPAAGHGPSLVPPQLDHLPAVSSIDTDGRHHRICGLRVRARHRAGHRLSVAVPTLVERRDLPEHHGTDGRGAGAARCIPELHVGISSIVLWYAWRRGRTAFAIALPLVIANWISTLYLRYHYMVDVLARLGDGGTGHWTRDPDSPARKQYEHVSALRLLPGDFVAQDRSRRRDVERLYVAPHGDGHHAVAMLQDVAADSLPFVAEHERDPAAEIDRFRRIAPRGRTVDPEATLLQRLDRTGKVRHLRHRHPLARARRGLHRDGRQPDAVVLRDHHQLDAEPIRHTQDRAEVLRIGDAVEDEDEFRGLGGDHVVEVGDIPAPRPPR